jgi:hypothetical protein
MEQLHPLIDKFMSAREKYRTILLKEIEKCERKKKLG